MHIDDKGMLKGPEVKWKKAHAFGGEMKAPRFIVVHDTAGRLTPFSSVNWFASKDCTTSAHFVVERDGTITQMVPTNRRAYHAGVSHWKGVSGLNSCSVGIEIVNPGKMDEHGTAWFGACCAPAEIIKKSSPSHGQGHWLSYTEAQVQSVVAICRALVEAYPDCNEVVTHWEISPKRKIDPNPLFPLEEVRRVVFDPTPGEVEHLPDPTPPPPVSEKEPSLPHVLANSVTGKLTLGTIITAIVERFIGIKDWIYEALGNALSVLAPAQQEAEATIAPLMSLTKTLKVNLGSIAYWMLVSVLVVILYRHLRDKAELTKLKQQLPAPPANTQTTAEKGTHP